MKGALQPMIEEWIAGVKESSDAAELGMILVHNGLVRGTSKEGNRVTGMTLSYKKELLQRYIEEFSKREGITAVRAWINEGNLKVGDDIMYALVAGRLRKYVIPVFEEFLSKIKSEVVVEEEI
jgi:molybdopterin synthase catalytic subunit